MFESYACPKVRYVKYIILFFLIYRTDSLLCFAGFLWFLHFASLMQLHRAMHGNSYIEYQRISAIDTGTHAYPPLLSPPFLALAPPCFSPPKTPQVICPHTQKIRRDSDQAAQVLCQPEGPFASKKVKEVVEKSSQARSASLRNCTKPSALRAFSSLASPQDCLLARFDCNLHYNISWGNYHI